MALLANREEKRKRTSEAALEGHYMGEHQELLEKLGTKPKRSAKTHSATKQADLEVKISTVKKDELIYKLMKLSQLESQLRGYAFEKFLKELFDAYGMGTRASFRITGEQIDGSFELHDEAYLLEAKWQSKQIDASELRSFHGKIEENLPGQEASL